MDQEFYVLQKRYLVILPAEGRSFNWHEDMVLKMEVNQAPPFLSR